MKRYSRTKNSTKIFIAATIVAAIIFGIFQILSCCDYSQEVAAKVNGKKIFKTQIEHKLSLLLGATGQSSELPALKDLPTEVIEILAKEIYLDEELAKIAKKSDAAKTDKIKHKIREAKNTILRQAYLDSIIAKEVTKEAISKKYSEISSELQNKKEYLVSHILLEDEKTAKKIARYLKVRRYSFKQAAKRYSLDKESSPDGGKLGFVLESNLIDEIAQEIHKLKRKQISNPIKTKFGWHLVRFRDVRDAQILPFEDVKEGIRQQLIKDILDRSKAQITKDAKVKVLIKSKVSDKVASKKQVKKSDAKAPKKSSK